MVHACKSMHTTNDTSKSELAPRIPFLSLSISRRLLPGSTHALLLLPFHMVVPAGPSRARYLIAHTTQKPQYHPPVPVQCNCRARDRGIPHPRASIDHCMHACRCETAASPSSSCTGKRQGLASATSPSPAFHHLPPLCLCVRA